MVILVSGIMARIELEDFGVLSVVILFALIGAIWGAIFGGLTVVLGAWQVGGVFGGQAAGLATGIIILAFAFVGMIAGGLTALFYNLLARFLGGVMVGVNLEDVQELRDELNRLEMEAGGVGSVSGSEE